MRRARSLEVLVLAVLAFALSPGTAFAVPGEIVGGAISLQDTGAPEVASSSTSTTTKLPSGGYLNFSDTAKLKKLGKNEYLIQERVLLKVQKYSSRGKRDVVFAKSPIGRGLKIARHGEVAEMRLIVPAGSGSYFAWATTSGYVPNDGPHWPRSVLVAFHGRTGRLIESFGNGGILYYGPSSKKFYTLGSSDANAVALGPNGSVITCGENLAPTTPRGVPGHYVSRPFAVKASLRSRAQEPFFSTGSPVAATHAIDAEARYKSCSRIASAVDGRVYMSGYLGATPSARARKWLGAYLANGAPDSSFGDSGQIDPFKALPSAVSETLLISKLLVGPDSNLYLGGYATGSKPGGFVSRFRPDGAVDSGFGDAGFVWTKTFAIDDLGFRPDGSLLVSGRARGNTPAAGWITSAGKWDPNFMGTGRHVYRGAFSSRFYQLSLGSNALLGGFSDPAQKQIPCRCSQNPLVSMENKVRLDSSINRATREDGRVKASGYAAAPTGVDRVEVGVSYDGSIPKNWTLADGTSSWSARLSGIRQGAKRVWLFSRVTDAAGVVETAFGMRDRNKIGLK